MNETLKVIPLANYFGTFFDSPIPSFFVILLAISFYTVLFFIISVALVGYLERKIAADIQMRVGPNRAGPIGAFQIFADFLAAIFKQDSIPTRARRRLFISAPLFLMSFIMIAFGAIPFADSWVLSNFDWSAVFVVVMLGLIHLMMFFAGYSTGSAWSILSSFRGLVLFLSFLCPVALSLLAPILIAGDGSISSIVAIQGGAPWKWMVISYPPTILSFFSMFVGLLIWQGRAPFNLTASEGSMLQGLTSEYSGVRASYFEYIKSAQLFFSSCLLVTIFLGGWHFPVDIESFGRAACIFQCLFFLLKVFVLTMFSIWIRWALPSVRVQQVLALSWRILVPLALSSSLLTGLWMVMTKGHGMGDLL